ncbi:uncharacterized protein LAESUDRAFT_758042 [Laetiporus sulphureus 93-53]|uniref:Mis12-domain-containing protein n=1 Tax=Laetiporus sulphureus 93-53 TaxID=1314785 RepID=A0A165EX24_9APHY|nr:uncharacterized protein LAESUDRAFT_758042 [Laetiporus sulphureus 93-53]KZT07908.1 hypothetical protein LAESUDRAFT_758042 [Laetiporus sulphureus 93-53]
MSGPPPTAPSVLLPELLGFVPQFLLDDIINIANEATRQAVDAMEAFLERRAARTGPTDATNESKSTEELEEGSKSAEETENGSASTEELEKGLNSFQTLLESHVDIAFDFFEAWSLRNIFAIQAYLPIVAPHQKGLNLDEPPEKEDELFAEIKQLRVQLQAQRKLRRLYTHAVRMSAAQLAHSQRRLERLSFLRSPQMQTLLSLPDEFHSMYNSVSSLPPIDASLTKSEQSALSAPGKRPWETSRTGYLNWAVEQLMMRVQEKEKGEGSFPEQSSSVGAAAESANRVGSVDDIKAALEQVEGKDTAMKLGVQDEGERMETD